METSSYETNIRLRPLRLPMLLQARQQRPEVIASRSSSGFNALRPSGGDRATPFYRDSFIHPIAISRPFIDSNIDSPSSPGSLIWTTTSDSSSLAAPSTPTTGSAVVYCPKSNPRPIRPISAPPTLSQIPLNSTEVNISFPLVSSVYCLSTVELEAQKTARKVPTHHKQSNCRLNAAEGLNTHPSTATSYQEVDDMYDTDTDWINFPSFCLDSDLGAEWAQFRNNQYTTHNHVTKRSHHLYSRLKTVLVNFSQSMKPKRTVPVSLSISPPTPLELPGYNGSLALNLSSPIQVARFLYASEETHAKRHKANKFPRSNRGLYDSPVRFERQLSVPEFAVDNFSDLDTSSLGKHTEQSVTRPKQRAYIDRKHGQIDQLTMDPGCDQPSFSLPSQTFRKSSAPDSLNPKRPRVIDPSICTDIAHAVTSLRSSSPTRFSVKPSHMRPQRDLRIHVSDGVPCLPFDPERMPFAAKRFSEKSNSPSSRSIPDALRS